MNNTIRQSLFVKFPPEDIGDGYRYFSGLYNDAIKLLESGRKRQGLRMMERGSREYSFLFMHGYPLSNIITDDCSLYLCQYYERNRKKLRLNKIRNRNFVEFQGQYYLLSTHKTIVFRMVPLDELYERDKEYIYGIDFPEEDDITSAVLKLINNKIIK